MSSFISLFSISLWMGQWWVWEGKSVGFGYSVLIGVSGSDRCRPSSRRRRGYRRRTALWAR